MRAQWQRLSVFWRDRTGATMAEFAMVTPILVLMMLGALEFARYVLLEQKLDRIATSVADLAAQGQTISENEINSLFTAASEIASPFNLGDDGVVILTSVAQAAGGGSTTVRWQRKGGGTAQESSVVGDPGESASLPQGFSVRAGDTVIIGEVFYNYTPFVLPDLIGNVELYHRAMFRPRLGSLTTIEPSP